MSLIDSCSLTGQADYCNKTINTAGDTGKIICWKQYGNDTEGNKNSSMGNDENCFKVFTAGSLGTKSANLKGTRTKDFDTDMNQNTETALSFDEADFDSNYFSHNSGAKLKIETAGDYWFAATLPMYSTSARSNTIMNVYKNGVKQEVGASQCSYKRVSSTHNHASNHLTFFLKDLAVGDNVEVRVKKDDQTDVTVDGKFTLFAKYVEDKNVFYSTGENSTSGPDLNEITEYAMEWKNDIIKESSYDHSTSSNPEKIELNEIGNYLVSVNIPFYSSGTRTNIRGKVKLDGQQVTGGEFKQGYVRQDSGHNHSSIHWTGIVSTTSTNQNLTITVQQEAASGTVTVTEEMATLYIEKLPLGGVFYANATQVGDENDWNTAAKTAINWSNGMIDDDNYYSHSGISKNSVIQILQGGDYLLTFNTAFIDPNCSDNTNYRKAPRATVQLNGVDYEGAIGSSGYIRDVSGHCEASDTITIPLTGLSAGDNITVSMDTGSAETGPVNDSVPAILGLYYYNFSNTVPSITGVEITPQIPNSANDLTCNATGWSDNEGNSEQYHFNWYNNSVHYLHVLQASNIHVLGSGNTSVGEEWNCTVTPYDGYQNGSSMSDNVTIVNGAPSKVTLVSPSNNDDTSINRTQVLNWSEASDPENDPLTYEINITRTTFAGEPGCGVNSISVSGISILNYTTQELCVDDWYDWKVRAYDGQDYGEWSDTWNFSVQSYMNANLLSNNINFGFISQGEVLNTSKNSSESFKIENTGNVKLNLTIYGNDSLWIRDYADLNTSYFQFKANNSDTEVGTFDTGNSQMTWTNVTNYAVNLLGLLDYNNTKDTALIDILVEAPEDETGENKNSTLIITLNFG
jgi:hypothetical protein